MDIAAAIAEFASLKRRWEGEPLIPVWVVERVAELAEAIVGWVDGGGFVPDGAGPWVAEARRVMALPLFSAV